MALPFYALTLFVSAFLLFLVQPMIGKLILPRLGGTPQVWNTCMVFFQSALLAGYAYTHAMSTRLTLRRQLVVHGILLLAPLIVLLPSPFNISSFEPPRGANPVVYTLMFLTLIVGLPFFVVSTSAPLLQKWFAGTEHPSAKDPYFLYGASNLGSMLALLFYPLAVEPLMTLNVQTWTWAIGYVVLALLILGCAAMVWKSREGVQAPDPTPPAPAPEVPPPPLVDPAAAIQPASATRKFGKKKGATAKITIKDLSAAVPQAAPRLDEMTAWRRIRWVLLAFAPSSMMLGVTSYMSTDLSPIPLFWVLPLSLYLLSFILVFLRYPIPWTEMPHRVMSVLQPAFICFLALILVTHAVSPVWRSTSVTLLAFFFTAMVCHGELARDRPATQHLTEFFLWMSVGGMLGGVLNGLIAPVLFTQGVVEYPIAIAIGCLLRPQTKESGWVDETLGNAFPGLAPTLEQWGKSLGEMTLLTFTLVVLAVGGVWGGLVFAISGSVESAFLVQVLYLVGAAVVLSLIWLRFRSSQALPLITDLVLALFVLCLAHFLSYHAVYSWGWKNTDPKENGLAKLLGVLGLPATWAVDPDRETVGPAFNLLVFGVPLVIAFFYFGRPWRFGLAIGGILFVHLIWSERSRNLLAADRSYFGVLRVNEGYSGIPAERMMSLLQISEKELISRKDLHPYARLDKEGQLQGFIAFYTTLSHGTTLHGENYQLPGLARLATTYYHRKGPTGIIMERLNWFPGPENTYWADNRMPASLVGLGAASAGLPLPTAQLVGLWSEPPFATIGLGTGTMASYARPFQHCVFYEIDGKVRDMHLPPDKPFYTYFDLPKMRKVTNRNKKDKVEGAYDFYYDYLSNAIKRGANLEVIMGDARLSLEKEDVSPAGMNPRREKYYRVMEIDAFSSDAIPVHLITEEAIKLYFDKLHEDGVVCVHTSNRHVDLVQPVTDIATKLGLKYRVGKCNGEPLSGYLGHSGSEYVMLAREEKHLPKDGVVTSDLTKRGYMKWDTPAPPGNTVWTNDYSNMVGILRERFAFTILIGLLAGIGLMVVVILYIGKTMEEARPKARP